MQALRPNNGRRVSSFTSLQSWCHSGRPWVLPVQQQKAAFLRTQPVVCEWTWRYPTWNPLSLSCTARLVKHYTVACVGLESEIIDTLQSKRDQLGPVQVRCSCPEHFVCHIHLVNVVKRLLVGSDRRLALASNMILPATTGAGFAKRRTCISV